MSAKLVDTIREVAEPLAAELGLYLYDVQAVRAKRLIIRLLAERQSKADQNDGIAVGECAALSRRLGRALELDGVVPGSYTLEVSSPGLERRLKTRRHFEGAVGESVRLTTGTPVDGKTSFEGSLLAIEEDAVVLDVAGQRLPIALANVRKAQTVFRT